MSMLDVARFLSYSRSVDLTPEKERLFNLSMVNSGRLFSCLYSSSHHWDFGRGSLMESESVLDRGREI
ncbi:MAG: hypothetical protein GXY61_00600 [Lentisphaerae bacterium]|jgi:hypothetical protein|nr:hypothetical protein [Lentisphaerota bacterium]